MALFPRLADCSHFHYENVSIHPFTVTLKDIEPDGLILFMVTTFGGGWQVRRTWSQVAGMDARFHDCIISRATTRLITIGDLFARRSVCSVSGIFDDSEEVRTVTRGSRMATEDANLMEENREQAMSILKDYFSVFSTYTTTNINCAPILNFFEMDNHGYRLTVPDEDIVNKPAVAAAQVVRRHVAQDSDEITLEVGDFVSIVDMPAGAPWWRAKQGMRVGFFPAECVSVINRGASGMSSSSEQGDSVSDPSGYKQVTLSRGKTISRLILALFSKNRPTKLQLRRKGILRDRVFGSDLGVYLSASRREVPLPLMICAQIIEDNGIVDGIYRRSGAQTHVQNLRSAFDEDQRPTIDEELIQSDIHCFSSLLKIYFGELSTPLFSHTIYKMLRETLSIAGEAERLNATFRVVSRLPPPYFRTARYLFVHLNKMALLHTKTLMTAKNLAICWAPNLMKPLADLDYNRPDPSIMAEVRDNPRLVEYIITYAPQLFSDRPPNWDEVLAAKTTHLLRLGLNGLDGDQPSLLSLAEARRRFGCHSVLNVAADEEAKPSGLSKERARSMMVGPSRREGRDSESEAISMVPSSPVMTDVPMATSSPTTSNRNRLNVVLPALQQKQQIIQRNQGRQKNSDFRTSSHPSTSGMRPRSHSLVEAQQGSSLMNEMRQEQAKRRKRLKPSFSAGRRQPTRSQSTVGTVKVPDSSPCRVGASLFYMRAASVPDAPRTPLPPRPPLPSSQTSQRRKMPEKPPSPPLLSGGDSTRRSSFQRLQDSWQRRSVRGLSYQKSPSPSISSPSLSSSSSSSSSSESLTPQAAEEDGETTPKGRLSPVMIVARAVPATAPPPVVPRPRSSIRSSCGAEPPEYENLEHYRRLSGIETTTTATVSVDKEGNDIPLNRSVQERPVRRPHSPLPKPRAKRRSHLDDSPSLSVDPQFHRNNPVRQSLPTRMDRILTKFPSEVRCYLPETNV